MKLSLLLVLVSLLVAFSCTKPEAPIDVDKPQTEQPEQTGGSRVLGKVLCDGQPVSGVQVSDGIDVTLTGEDGTYELPTQKETGLIFITPPSGYVPVSTDGVKPDFYAHLKEDFSAETHDFQLRKEDQSSYSIMFLADLHLTNADFKPDQRVFLESVMPNVKASAQAASAKGPVYSVNLGDLSHERWWYKYSYNVKNAYKTMVDAGYPTLMWSIPGNHDNDSAIRSDNTDWDAGHVYRKVLGPEYYSVNIGNEHWVFMDNILYENSSGSNLAVGAVGKLDYTAGLTDRQIKWLRKDIANVSSDKNIVFCTHSTVISDNSSGYTGRKTQVDSVAVMLKRFNKVEFYNGHMHRMCFFDSKLYPGFKGIKIPATSGDMWESAPNYLIGCDGEDAGIYIVNFKGDEREDSYVTHLYGEKWMRLYDMNTVAEYYNNDSNVRAQMEKYPKRLDYGDGSYKNQILINYWMYKPGQTVQVYENGTLLKTKSVTYEDPLFNISYHIRTFLKQLPITPAQTTVKADHMFLAQAKTADSPIVVKVLGADGSVIHEQTMERPKAFGLDAQ